jgi:hypothetical protein
MHREKMTIYKVRGEALEEIKHLIFWYIGLRLLDFRKVRNKFLFKPQICGALP